MPERLGIGDEIAVHGGGHFNCDLHRLVIRECA